MSPPLGVWALPQNFRWIRGEQEPLPGNRFRVDLGGHHDVDRNADQRAFFGRLGAHGGRETAALAILVQCDVIHALDPVR